MDPTGASLGSAISGLATLTVKVFQISYEIKAVDEKARDLLETTNAITKTLDTAHTLLDQKIHLFSDLEQSWMTGVAFPEAERTLKKVVRLIENARVDMSVTHGKVRFHTRVMYVLKESPLLVESLASLTLAGQLLTVAIGVICGRSGNQSGSSLDGAFRTVSGGLKSPPPPYAESEFLSAHRRSRRREDVPQADILSDSSQTEDLSDNTQVGVLTEGELRQLRACASVNLSVPSLELGTPLLQSPSSPPLASPPLTAPSHLRENNVSEPLARGRRRNTWLEYHVSRAQK